METFIFKTMQFKFNNKWLLSIGLFASVVALSVLWNPIYTYDLIVIKKLFVKVFVPSSIAFIAINLFKKKIYIEFYIKNMSIVVVILVILAVIQMMLGITAGGHELRAGSTIGNPNGLAMLLVLVTPCILYGIETEIISKRIGLIVVGSVIVGVICTVSRKGYISIVLAFFLYYILTKQSKKLFFGFFTSIIIIAFIAITPVMPQRFTKENTKSTLETKSNMAKAAMNMFFEKPIYGMGFYGYYENFAHYHPLWTTSYHYNFWPHNMFYAVLADQGIIGFIPFICIFLYPLIRSLKNIITHNNHKLAKNNRKMAAVCMSTIIPFMFNGSWSGGVHYAYFLLALLYTQISFFFNTENNQIISKL